MKTNLDNLFKTDESLESSGVWYMVTDEAGFLIKRFGGYNSPSIKAALAKYYKPYARQVENGSISSEKEKEIMIKVFVNACVIDWKGIEIDGVVTPFSKDVAVKFLSNLPDLADTLTKYASDISNYREEVGNG